MGSSPTRGELVVLAVVDNNLGGPTSGHAVGTARSHSSMWKEVAVRIREIHGLSWMVAGLSKSSASRTVRKYHLRGIIHIVSRPGHAGGGTGES